jgi:putative transposase
MWPRRPPRVSSFEYRGHYRYLITAVTRNRAPFFINSAVANGIAAQIQTFFTSRDLEVIAYCVMPDHVHLLLEGISDRADLIEAVRIWKQISGHAWKARAHTPLWQSGFHDRVLRPEDDCRSVVRYILQNPVRAGLVRCPSDYRWLGSLRYDIADLEAHAGDWRPGWR